MPALLVFLLSATVIVAAGIRLTHDGDTISVRTGLGGAWTGAIVLAAATSLPELSTDVFAVQAGNPSMAVAELFGSSMANMLILALADLAVLRRHFLARIAVNQTLVGTLAIALTAIAAAGIVAGDTLVFGSVGWAPVLIVLGYLSGMRLLHLNRAVPPFETMDNGVIAAAGDPTPDRSSLRRAVIGFAIAAGVTFVAANTLADAAADVADDLGFARSFVGATMLALTTSLPEVTVTVAGIRRGAYDLAVGNLLGSNAFNMAILLALDIVDREGSVLARVEGPVLVTALFAILLMSQTLIEVQNRQERRILLMEPDALLRIGTYTLGLVLIYQLGGGA